MKPSPLFSRSAFVFTLVALTPLTACQPSMATSTGAKSSYEDKLRRGYFRVCEALNHETKRPIMEAALLEILRSSAAKEIYAAPDALIDIGVIPPTHNANGHENYGRSYNPNVVARVGVDPNANIGSNFLGTKATITGNEAEVRMAWVTVGSNQGLEHIPWQAVWTMSKDQNNWNIENFRYEFRDLGMYTGVLKENTSTAIQDNPIYRGTAAVGRARQEHLTCEQIKAARDWMDYRGEGKRGLFDASFVEWRDLLAKVEDRLHGRLSLYNPTKHNDDRGPVSANGAKQILQKRMRSQGFAADITCEETLGTPNPTWAKHYNEAYKKNSYYAPLSSVPQLTCSGRSTVGGVPVPEVAVYHGTFGGESSWMLTYTALGVPSNNDTLRPDSTRTFPRMDVMLQAAGLSSADWWVITAQDAALILGEFLN